VIIGYCIVIVNNQKNNSNNRLINRLKFDFYLEIIGVVQLTLNVSFNMRFF